MSSTNTKVSTKVEHPLAHLVPEGFFLDDYVSREIHGVSDLEIIDRARTGKHNVLIEGPTGSAKTSLVFAAGAKAGLPVVTVPCNGAAEPRTFIGGWTPQPDGSFDFVAGDLVKVVEHGGIIYLDEVNMLPPKIAAFLHGLLDRRRTITIPEANGSSFPTEMRAHENCQVIAAYNAGYQGTRPLNEAFKNRFGFKISFPYTREVEKELVTSSSLMGLADSLRLRHDIGDITTPVSTNMLLEFEEFAYDDALGFDFAVGNFINAFSKDEQAIVTEVMELESDNIYNDMFDTTRNASDDTTNQEREVS